MDNPSDEAMRFAVRVSGIVDHEVLPVVAAIFDQEMARTIDQRNKLVEALEKMTLAAGVLNVSTDGMEKLQAERRDVLSAMQISFDLLTQIRSGQ